LRHIPLDPQRVDFSKHLCEEVIEFRQSKKIKQYNEKIKKFIIGSFMKNNINNYFVKAFFLIS